MNRPTKGIVVDGSCVGNPGPVQWQGIDLETGNVLFRTKQYAGGTNNIAEFLAITHALAVYKEPYFVYSDSQCAIAWIKKGSCPVREDTPPELREIIGRANKYLNDQFVDPIEFVRKWETKLWGENPADFGRK